MTITGDPVHLWPPECCVPAFVNAAMMRFGISFADVNALPALLGVRIRPDQINPLNLPLASEAAPPGVRAVDADREINRLFTDFKVPLAFRRVPFLEVAMGSWEDVLKIATERKIVTALGLDYSVLTGRPESLSAHHVIRVIAQASDSVQFLDDSGESKPADFAASWLHVERAVLAIPDGFWMIGPEAELNLPLTLPWRGRR